MYVCIYVFLRVCAQVCMGIARVYVYMCICNIHTCTSAYMHTCIHTYINTYIHTYVHTYILTYIAYIPYVHTYMHNSTATIDSNSTSPSILFAIAYSQPWRGISVREVSKVSRLLKAGSAKNRVHTTGGQSPTSSPEGTHHNF